MKQIDIDNLMSKLEKLFTVGPWISDPIHGYICKYCGGIFNNIDHEDHKWECPHMDAESVYWNITKT